MHLLVVAGRMSLTNYVMQSVFGVTLFYGYGFGLWGRIGSAWLVALVAFIFGAQAYLSACWLRAFRFGPLEWAWRCFTYRQRLELRRESVGLDDITREAQFVGDSR